jgi:hypothetical protein
VAFRLSVPLIARFVVRARRRDLTSSLLLVVIRIPIARSEIRAKPGALADLAAGTLHVVVGLATVALDSSPAHDGVARPV